MLLFFLLFSWQAGARESLPDVPLKGAFEKAFANNQLVDPADSAR